MMPRFARHRSVAIAPRVWMLVLVLFTACIPPKTDPTTGKPPSSATPKSYSLGVAEQNTYEVTCPAFDPSSSPLPPDLEPTATAPAGTIPGSFSVSSTGEASYVMPLVTPPGRAGVEPKLALAYDSASGDGVLGMGFSLAGLSAITPCPANLAQDHDIAPVRYDRYDKLCLDGKRLVPITEGGSDVEYRTFPDTLTRVVAHWPQGAGLRGPDSFDVYTRSGLHVTYGTTDDSKVWGLNGAIRAWWAAKGSDRRGNFIVYSYLNTRDQADHHTIEHLPSEIDYTGFDGSPMLAPSRSVRFSYEDKASADVRTLYTRGMPVLSSQRLQSIQMSGPGTTPVRDYVFGYDPVSKRTLLTSVQECAADKACKPPTRFTYSQGTLGFKKIVTPIVKPFSDRASPMLLDVTGDGLDDLVVPDVADMSDPTSLALEPVNGEAIVHTYWNVARNLGANHPGAPYFSSAGSAHRTDGETPQAPADTTQLQPELGTAIDYDQDGLMDVFLHDVYGEWSTWHVLLSRPNHTFKFHDTKIPRPVGLGTAPPPPHLSDLRGSAHLADVNGDGVPDLVQCVDHAVDSSDPLNQSEWHLHRWEPKQGSTGPGWQKQGVPIDALLGYPCNTELHTVDVNGDGKIDLVVKGADRVSGNLLFKGTYDALTRNHNGTWSALPTELPVSLDGRVIFLDVNGDGLPDALEPKQDRQLYTYMNTGKGFAQPVKSLASPILSGADTFLNLAAPIDYDGDGRQDLLIPLVGVTPDGSGSVPTWTILQSTGSVTDGTFTLVDPQIPFEPAIGSTVTSADPRGPRVTDVNGDGAQDVVLLLGGAFSVFENLAADQDLLVGVTDGMNAHDPGDPGWNPNVAITYDHLADLSITDGVPHGSADREKYTYLSRYRSGNGCEYPRHCVVGPRRVVKGYTLSNADKLRHFTVKYADGRYHRLGRGFLGFGGRIVLDGETGAGTEDVYDNVTYDADLRTFPNAGQVIHERRWNPGLPTQPNADQIELSYTDVELTTVYTYNDKTYFTLPTDQVVRREQGSYPPLGQTKPTVLEYVHGIAQHGGATKISTTASHVFGHDSFGNVTEVVTVTGGTGGVDLVSKITRTYKNDTSRWLIGLLEGEVACSEAHGVEQCRTGKRHHNTYGEVYTDETGSADQNPETRLTRSFQRDAFGNVFRASAQDALGNRRGSCTTYDGEGIFPVAHKNAAGHLTYVHFDPGLGVLTALVDPNQLTVKWAHDGFGRITEEHRPDGTSTTFTLERDKAGGPQHDAHRVRLETVTDGGGSETVELDSLGRPILRLWYGPQIATKKCAQIGCPTLYPGRLMQRIVFDDLGEHVARRSLPAPEGTPESKLLNERYEYDAVGRVVRRTPPWNQSTDYSYDGTTVQITDPLGIVSHIHNDALGRPESIVDNGGGITAYSYGPFGNVRTVTAPDNTVTTMVRDAWGRVIEVDDPDRGKTISHYDGFGELASSTDALNRTATFTHDALGRTIARVDQQGASAPAPPTTWTWDTAPMGIGKIAEVTSPDGQKSYTYDGAGRPETTTLAIGGESFVSSLTYDGHGRVATVQYPAPATAAPFTVAHDYDPYGHLVAVRDPATNLAYWKFTGVDGAGRLSGETFGNGVVTARQTFADKQRVKSIFTTNGSATIQDLAYDYDVKLNLASRHDGLQTTNKTERFRYDDLDRLTCAHFGDVANPKAPCAQSYSYDVIGNLKSKTGVGAYAYDDRDHPHAVTSAGADAFEYDAAGNQTHRPGMTKVSYTPFDLPKTFTLNQGGGEVALDYDGDQRRIRKTTPSGEETVYFGDLYERVTHSDSSIEHRYYVHSSERLIALVTRRDMALDSTRYVHTDNLGSVDVLTDESGNVDARQSYDPFGARRNPKWGQPVPATPPDTTRGFTGHESDEDLGLVNMKGRIYDPRIGRFLTPDPIVSVPSFSQSWNPYSYVLNNPLAYVDPSGFEGWTVQPSGEVVFADDALTANGSRPPIGPPPPGSQPAAPAAPAAAAPPVEPPPPVQLEQDISQSLAAGAARLPNDVGTLGNTSGHVAQPVTVAGLPFVAPGLPGSPLGVPGPPAPGPLNAPGPFGPNSFGPGSFVEPPPPGAVPVRAPGLPVRPGPAVTPGGAAGGVLFILTMGMIFSGDAPETTIGPTGIPTNKRGEPYPDVVDPGRGLPIPFPAGPLPKIPERQRTPYDGSFDRYRFIKEWVEKGYPAPPQGWGGKVTHVHHIKPLEYGGTNDFSNLVPLAPAVHQLFTNWWNSY